MRTALLALPVLLAIACGGIVLEPTPGGGAAGGGTGDETVVSAEGTPVPTTTPPAATTAVPPPPQPPPAEPPPVVPPSVLAGATVIEARGDTLGAPPGLSNRRSYRLDLATNVLEATYAETAATVVLRGSDRAELDAVLAQVEEVPLPSLCAYDGPTAALVVTRSGTSQTYLAEDYNCMHRRDVSYATRVQSVLGWFDAKVRLVGGGG